MPLLRIQHAVPDYDDWKRAFDSDPLGRKAAGVRRYDIHLAVTDANLVMIDLEFDTAVQAERMLRKLKELWAGPGAAVTRHPQAWILETVESRTL
jgi:hypothetical protein